MVSAINSIVGMRMCTHVHTYNSAIADSVVTFIRVIRAMGNCNDNMAPYYTEIAAKTRLGFRLLKVQSFFYVERIMRN